MFRKRILSLGLAIALASGAAFAADKINLNNASIEQLKTLNGVGVSTAEAIVAYREANGGFQSTDELVNVRGIGQVKAGQLAEQVSVEE